MIEQHAPPELPPFFSPDELRDIGETFIADPDNLDWATRDFFWELAAFYDTQRGK